MQRGDRDDVATMSGLRLRGLRRVPVPEVLDGVLEMQTSKTMKNQVPDPET